MFFFGRTIPSAESALAASRAYATHPHLAGSSEDFQDAKIILKLFQDEFGITSPESPPIFPAGSHQSRHATLKLTSLLRSRKPSAWVDIYYPVLNTPLDRSLEIIGNDGRATWSADLVEDGDPLDEEAHKYKDAVPTWHGLSKGGTAEGQLVYANYGAQEDYASLVEAGADLTGKIVIVRYGGIFRGLKIKGAEELGAAGVLIYSDPRDDGYVTVENGYAPYPAGPARNPTSVQRGSVQYLSLYPGDPTTPGYPAYENSTRTEGSNIPGIPSLPISWQNAERLLEEIDNPHQERDILKSLSGKPSSATIKLVNNVDNKVTPIWNAMASIPGHIRNEVVVIGCHRDAWVMGAADPTSGTVSLHEIIRGFGALLKNGWKPLRTVVIASWDAEEYGLVGSTEWGEDFSKWISDHVVSYINVDVSVAGSRWGAGGSPSLAHLIKRTALDVAHPTIAGKTLWDARDDEGPFTGTDEEIFNTREVDETYLNMYLADKKERHASQTGIPALGSGSDYTVFLQRLGVASTDQGFGFTPTDAVYHYHSVYDSQRWQETYADPGFQRHAAVAQHLGLMALRLIDSIVIPLNTTQYALELSEYLAKVESLTPDLHLAAKPDFSSLHDAIHRVQTASFDLDKEKVEAEEEFEKALKKLRASLPGHKCTRRRNPWTRLTAWIKETFRASPHDTSSHDVDVEAGDWLEYYKDISTAELHHPHHPHGHIPRWIPSIRRFIKAAKRVSAANKQLINFERGFISEDGIKDREWYKHLGVAPGKWLGYGATTFPALTESLSIEKNTTLADYEAGRLAELLVKLADGMSSK
ncbi:hypothetical protein BD779DRAFT_1432452 [Infundibulicybe gibba]|nr:hypothetical protein BD779DRAFT_1432452 [Infundibulicybe gibba]